MDYEPLPLIKRPIVIPGDDTNELRWSLEVYGYLLIVLTWLLAVISLNLFFHIWRFVVAPLEKYDSTVELHGKATKVLEQFDLFILKGWAIYVLLWWWSLVSWCSLSLFRHSKGLQR